MDLFLYEEGAIFVAVKVRHICLLGAETWSQEKGINFCQL